MMLSSFPSAGQVFFKKGKDTRRVMEGNKVRFDKRHQYLSLGPSAAAMNYFGDLSPSGGLGTDFQYTRPGLGVVSRWKYNHFLTFGAAFHYGRIAGSDFRSAEEGTSAFNRNLHFRNDIKELSAFVQFFPWADYGNFWTRDGFAPYLWAGIGGFHHNPQAMRPDGSGWENLRPLGTEGQTIEGSEVSAYSLWQMSIPVGIGFRFRLNRSWDLNIEAGYRFTFTDHLDDVSGDYPDIAAIPTPLGQAMSWRGAESTFVVTGAERNGSAANPPSQGTARGNPGSNDGFLMTKVQFSYILFSKYYSGPLLR